MATLLSSANASLSNTSMPTAPSSRIRSAKSRSSSRAPSRSRLVGIADGENEEQQEVESHTASKQKL